MGNLYVCGYDIKGNCFSQRQLDDVHIWKTIIMSMLKMEKTNAVNLLVPDLEKTYFFLFHSSCPHSNIKKGNLNDFFPSESCFATEY